MYSWTATDTGISARPLCLIKCCMLHEWLPFGYSKGPGHNYREVPSKTEFLSGCFLYFKELWLKQTINSLKEKRRSIVQEANSNPTGIYLPELNSRAEFQSWMWIVDRLTLCSVASIASTVSSLLWKFLHLSVMCPLNPQTQPIIPIGHIQKVASKTCFHGIP